MGYDVCLIANTVTNYKKKNVYSLIVRLSVNRSTGGVCSVEN